MGISDDAIKAQREGVERRRRLDLARNRLERIYAVVQDAEQRLNDALAPLQPGDITEAEASTLDVASAMLASALHDLQGVLWPGRTPTERKE